MKRETEWGWVLWWTILALVSLFGCGVGIGFAWVSRTVVPPAFGPLVWFSWIGGLLVGFILGLLIAFVDLRE